MTSCIPKLPEFQHIQPESILDGLKQEIKKVEHTLNQILNLPAEQRSFENCVIPLEKQLENLSRFWSPISHLHNVIGSSEWRTAFANAEPILIDFQSRLSKNVDLFQIYLTLSEANTALNPEQQATLNHALLQFTLAGVHLDSEKKATLSQLEQELMNLSRTFNEHVCDATQQFILPIQNPDDLSGLSEHALALCKQAAEEKKLSGYALTLDYPIYSAAMEQLDNRTLRQTLYFAYATRASDQDLQHPELDNSTLMCKLLQGRKQYAELLGFPHFPAYSLASKMANSPEEVLAFLEALHEKTYPIAKQEWMDLETFAKHPLKPWDLAYYREKYQAHLFSFTQESLRPYFPVQSVLQGLIESVQTLFGIQFKLRKTSVWHTDVIFYEIFENQHCIGGIYFDLFARQGKREGAWMDECQSRFQFQNEIQLPIAFLTCNFAPPTASTPSLLTHDDVLTLFHELGHCLQHVLTQVSIPSIAGIRGIEWDAVELPSQFMEYFCYDQTIIQNLSCHYQTGEKCPDDLYQKCVKARYFHTGLQRLRQLEFAWFDFELHLKTDISDANEIQDLLNRIREKTQFINLPSFQKFQHSFLHIFSGGVSQGYAAGYYSYQWAEVLAADAFYALEEAPDEKTRIQLGNLFRNTVLARGGSLPAKSVFMLFRGREPSIAPLIQLSGLSTPMAAHAGK